MTEIKAAIAAERRDIADILAALPPEQWDTASLCEGWRVREVVAHMTMPFRYSMPRFALGMIAARGNFNRMADRAACRDAGEMTPEQLTECLRDNAEHRWKPPGGGYEGALSHDVIHGLDITEGIGLARTVPADRLRIVLDAMSPRQLKFFGTDLDGIELRATDLDWSYGSGTPVTGAAQDLLLAACGRTLTPGKFAGPAAGRFR